jgi:hypothetical protein
MRKFVTASMAVAALTLAVSLSAPVLADGTAADPTVDQIYQAAKAGHLDQAQTMMDQVLRDHPGSATAHYVQAQLFAKEGRTQEARSELARAEEIAPGLPHEKPQAVQALKSELGMLPRGGQSGHVTGMTVMPAPAHAAFPWGLLLIVVGAIVVLYLVFRPRQTAVYAGGPVIGGGGAGYAPGYGGPGYGGPGMGGGGIGSGIAGGLASGLAVGAGVVAGEELAHHFLDGGRSEGVAPQQVDNGGWDQPSSNSDMGGSDFGVNDPGSWDDSGGGGGGGGGDDWT